MASKRMRAWLVGSATLLAGALLAAPWAGAAPAPAAPSAQPAAQQTMTVWKVPFQSEHQSTLLSAAGFDVLERREGQNLFVMGDDSVRDRLRQLGFAPTVDKVIPMPHWTPPKERGDNSKLTPQDGGDTYYGGYHTVNGQYAHLDNVAKAHPDLTTNVTYGQSWRKANNKPNGYDLRAICITKKQQGDCDLNPNSPKPRFFLMGQIHAREIATGDVAYRWIDYLLDNYGKDDRVTKLMDSTELWVVPIANPDGVDVVQQGGDNPILRRKNDDTAIKDCGAPDTGVDLNRNANSHWGGASTSTDPCNEVFDGPKPDSEVENTALEKLFTQLYPAVRGQGDTDPSPPTAKGLFITMHSDAGMVLFPWEFDAKVHSGNDKSLRAMAADMGKMTNYQSGQAGEILYNASGGTDDWVYQKLGTASFTIELGDYDGDCTGFFPGYHCSADHTWPAMQQALLYAGEHAAAPFKS